MKFCDSDKQRVKIPIVRVASVILCVMICAYLIFFFTYALIVHVRTYYSPWSLYDGVWVAEDSDITIKIYRDDMDGTILYDNTELQIHCWPHYESLSIYIPDSNDDVLVPIVDLKCWYYAEDEFSAKVVQTYVPYFEKGQKITFRRVD